MSKRKIMLSSVLVLSLGLLFYSQARGATEVEIQNTYFDAIIAGDLKAVQQFLTNDPNLVSAVNTRGKGIRIPALHLAVMYGHSDLVELLLSKGAEANVRDEHGVSALEVAARGGHANVVAPLVSYGGDINGEQHKLQRSPLCYASNGDVAEALIANGADVNWQDKLDITPLHFIAKDGATEAAKVLIKHGAKVDAKSKYGQTPLHWAAKRGRRKVAELLLASGADIKARDDRGLTALNWAVQAVDRTVDEKAMKATARLLVSRGAEYAISDAAWLGDLQKVEELLRGNPSLANAVDSGLRESVLGTAVRAGETEIAELLLAHGADPNGTSRFGLPSLHLAAALGNRAVVRMLLESGVDVNKQGKSGESALHWAAAKGHNDIVQLLLQAGANVNTKASEARSNIDAIPPDDFDTISELLRYRRARAKQQRNPRLQIMGLIRVVFVVGDTPLHSAAQWGHAEIVKLFLGSGAAVDAANRSEQTPLHYASVFGHQSIEQLLINKGADINAKDKNGYTPQELSLFAEWVSH